MTADPIGDIDLQAYVDGELDDERRVQVEDYLAHNPAAAAQVMADLRTRSALRLLAARATIGASDRATAAANRLSQGFARRSLLRHMRLPAIAVAGVLALVAAPGDVPLVGGVGSVSAAPAYLDEALMAHRTTQVRAWMRSQPEVPHFDSAEMMQAAGIRIPRLPKGWRILDVQLFPSDEGPALQLAVTTGDGRPLSMFAVKASTTAPMEPQATRRGGQTIAYWREGDLSYAVIGPGTPQEIDRLADDLEDNDPA